MTQLNNRWTRASRKEGGEKYDERTAHIESLMHSSDSFRGELGAILKDMMNSSEMSIAYDIPGWPYKRADQDGYNRALRTVLDIIGVDKT